MKLNQMHGRFQELGVGIAGMTYDDPELIREFHDEWELAFPLLRDVDVRHVEAWGIRNEQYDEGSFGYGIPYPGVVLLSPEGRLLAKFAERGYRSRPDWERVLEEVRAALDSAPEQP